MVAKDFQGIGSGTQKSPPFWTPIAPRDLYLDSAGVGGVGGLASGW